MCTEFVLSKFNLSKQIIENFTVLSLETNIYSLQSSNAGSFKNKIYDVSEHEIDDVDKRKLKISQVFEK